MTASGPHVDVSENVLYLPLDASLRPPLKWAGGKRWLLPELAPLWKPFANRRMVEPFCGALSATLALVPRSALLNDSNPHVINFYSCLKSGLSLTLWMENERELFYVHRKRFNELLATGSAATPEAAGLFYYLNRTCYNGLCRFNRSGEFNVPFGRHKTINYIRDFTSYQRLFEKWQFTSTDFEQVPLEPGDFVYADPPFDVPFTQYSKEGFSWEDQVRAAEWLAKHEGPVVLSNEATERIVVLYEKLGFKLRFLDAPRRISCKGERKPAKEVLAVRNLS
ncbi:MAG TPA: Dam family site-specific DNA-(adenine-N6)-methyltransferase [Candidatus Dormibacteraeota bacterium]|nr:Dam family site-specific DNA-(adenine-N6)-methyltransferase [Candidatus Dormibacteraeota bacterium]